MGNCTNRSSRDENDGGEGLVEKQLPPGSRQCDAVLRPLLESGAIALVDARYLMTFQGAKLPPRQELPEHAFLPFESLLGGNGYKFSSVCYRRIIVLSHMWLDRNHPDPHRTSLDRLTWALRLHINELYENDSFGIFWDYASLYQHPDKSNGILRSPQEENLFQEGLEGIAYLFMHPDTYVFQITKLPSDYVPTSNHNGTAYGKRGWTLAEHCWASLLKISFFLRVFDISQLRDTGNSFLDLLACGMYNRQVPLPPEHFDSLVEDLSFTNGKDDRPLIKQLHRKAITELFQHVDSLSFETLGWNESEAQHLLAMISQGYVPNLEFLSLEGNRLGVAFCEEFVPVIQPVNLVRLNLASNPVGGDGASILAPVLSRIKYVKLAEVGLTASGCGELMDALSDETILRAELVQLDLGGNPIGDEGINTLEPLLVRIACVQLENIGLTDSGCQSLARRLNETTRWVKLLLSKNRLESHAGLETIIRRSPRLRSLYVDENPLPPRSISKLKRLCKRSRVKLYHGHLDKLRRDFDALWADSDLRSIVG